MRLFQWYDGLKLLVWDGSSAGGDEVQGHPPNLIMCHECYIKNKRNRFFISLFDVFVNGDYFED